MKNIIIILSFLFILTIGGFLSSLNNKVQTQNSSVLLKKIENWGPKETPKGVKFNVQPNGMSAIWVLASEVSKHPNTYVTFGTNEIKEIAVSDKGLTFYVIDELLANPGAFEIAVIEGDSKKKIVIGTFTVK
jgi:hypothetical protein